MSSSIPSLRASLQVTPARPALLSRASLAPLPQTKRPYPQFPPADGQVAETPTLSSLALPTFAFDARTTLVPFNCFATYSIKLLDTFDICQTSPTPCQHHPPTMAGLFKRLYDWLLRLFWYVQCQRRTADAAISVSWSADRPWRKGSTVRAGRTCADCLRCDAGRPRWT